ncbi:NADH-quinone oxidoreductase subunit NuoF [Desulfoprunum sp.]|jgi:NADH-quinone oxidoreductase subunit F|uniref:NADH-quinone oxidoreductase subunit NuoF n=1 Tax=Desulfoprunum sp. TaxID=2020866 RepID=UPI00052D6CEB|nr:NADH dehydrogenase [Desulfobulbus sp. Tol-SR]
MGTGGIAAGAEMVMKAFQDEFAAAGLENATVQNRCKLHKVGCRGFCAKDVLVDISVNGEVSTYQYIQEDMVKRLVRDHVVGGKPIKEWMAGDDYHVFHDNQTKVVLHDLGKINPESIDDYLSVDGYTAAKKALTTMTAEQVINEVKNSGLRGRGGGGFPTGLKWSLCAANEADQRYVICNADEGDPGAFMDRSVVEGNPHAVVEGMIITAYAIGATRGYVYIRAEYPLAVHRLRIALDQAREKGFLGEKLFGGSFEFDIKIKLGAGAFVCGEETALIASIEGERGMPRAKPPFPANKGLWGKPTIINNVETLANLPPIINKGAEWFASIGSEKSKGTKVIALTGKIRNTGLIEIPMGMPLNDIIFKIGGGIEGDKLFKAVQTGGPSGGCIPQQFIDLPVDYEGLKSVGSMMGSGGMVVLDETDCMVNIAKFFLTFTQEESCGKCVPCRIGTKRLLEILTRITEGKGKKGDIELLQELAEDVRDSSLCGLGMSAPNPVISTIKYFRHEYEAHINRKKCPAKVCNKLLTFFIRPDQCVGCGMCAKACSVKAVSGELKQPHSIDNALCIQCGSCFDVCKFNAVVKD